VSPATVVESDLCPKGPGRPRDERASRAITEAALRQLADLGYAKVSMESVATEAGVARATIYRRYRDKADLVTAAIATNGGDLPTRPSDDPRQDLVRFLTQFDARFAEHCLEVLGGLLGAREEPHALALHRQRVIEPRTGYARSLLVRAQELGQLDPDADVDLALQMLVGVVFARRVNGIPSERGWAERAVDAIWKGMGPPTA
jgi:AcrR family transcriptional regulator